MKQDLRTTSADKGAVALDTRTCDDALSDEALEQVVGGVSAFASLAHFEDTGTIHRSKRAVAAFEDTGTIHRSKGVSRSFEDTGTIHRRK